MDKQYFIERLREAAEKGWEKALATFEDDVVKGFIKLAPSDEFTGILTTEEIKDIKEGPNPFADIDFENLTVEGLK